MTMSEIARHPSFQPEELPSSSEIRLPRQREWSEEVSLHGRNLALRPDLYLYDRRVAVDNFGINGNVLAIIKLPARRGARLSSLNIAVTDYQGAGEGGIMFCYKGLALPSLGRLSRGQRYALIGLNYTCPEHLALWAPLPTEGVVLGRNSDNANYLLGLVSGDLQSEYGLLSRAHATVTLNPEGRVVIRDHSTNGTVVERSI